MRCPSCGRDGRQVGSSQTFECPACGAVYLQSQGREVPSSGQGGPAGAEGVDAQRLAQIRERAELERLAKAAQGRGRGIEAGAARSACRLPWALLAILAGALAAAVPLWWLAAGDVASGVAGGLEALAQAGDPAAQFSLALVRDYGLDDAAPNVEAAQYWYRKAAEGGSASAQAYLGQWYLSRAPRPNRTEAVFWLKTAAGRGEPAAQAWLGTLYRTGEGVEKDLGEAASWYLRAAEQGNPEAMCGLARLHAGADGGSSRDPPSAAMYDQLAKALGKDCGLADYGASAKLADWAEKEGRRRAQERLAKGFGRQGVR